MHSTVVFSRFAASSLNRRTLSAQVRVSMLGKTLSTTRCPASSAEEYSARSFRVSVKGGSASPIAGSSPTVCTIDPREFVVAMPPVYLN